MLGRVQKIQVSDTTKDKQSQKSWLHKFIKVTENKNL